MPFLQDRNEFELSTLPALTPVLGSASGETLLLLVKHAELIISKANHEHLLSHVLPLLVRAYDDADARIQEEVLRRTVCLAKQLDSQLVKQAILPRVHGLALKTTVAAVRVNALLCLGDLVSSLDKHAALDILQTLQRCTAVDRSVPTLMCTLGVANSMYKQYGVEFAAEHVLPLLVPLLIAQQLNVQQFGKKIEEKRGVSVSDSGAADVSVKHTGVNGHPPEAVQKPSGHLSSSTKSTSSWDSDWGSMLKKTTSSYRAEESNLPPKSAATTSEPTPVSNPRFQSTSAPDLHVPLSCPAVDIEWPPLAPTIDQSSQVVENDKQKSNPQLPGDSGFDEIDPFADWPPRPTHTVNNSLGSMIHNSTGMPNQGKPVMGASLASTINNSMGMSMQNQGRPAPNANPASLPLNNSIGLSKLYEQTPSSTINTSSSSSFPINSSVGRGTSAIQTARKEVDLGSMFPSAKSEQPPALRIAPPPPAGKSGGGRGRHQGRTDSASLYSLKNPKAKSEQPPLLDLL
ncbi:SCY1-like protein 2 [Nymphaea thermarum]|nr:SCY1-like protein 2 [Nymphaea thermarum]